MTLKLADRRIINNEQWRELRRAGIGGSDAAAILGLNPYATPLSVYYDKVESRNEEQNLAMEIGIELEPFLCRKFQEWIKCSEGHDIQVNAVPFMLANPDHPFMLANLDGQFEHPALGNCGLELKTTGEFNRRTWENDKVPDHCYIQVQHYMAVTGLQQFYVGVLIGNKIFSATMVPRNQEVIDTLIEELARFWKNHVLEESPPGPSGLECDTHILKEMFPYSKTEFVIELPHCYDMYLRYKDLKEKEKLLKKEIEEIRQHFMSEMQDAEVAHVNGRRITWKVVERKGYTVLPSSSRVLRIN